MHVCTFSSFFRFIVVSNDLVNKAEELLSHYMDLEAVSHLLIANELITQDNLDAASSAPCQYLQNSYLLEHIDLMDASVLRKLIVLLQESTNETNKSVGRVLLQRE